MFIKYTVHSERREAVINCSQYILVTHRSNQQQQEMSKIKLTHYNARGRAETIRLVLAYAGKEFEDKRIAPGRKIQVAFEAPAVLWEI